MAVADLGQVFLDVARQMRRQTAVDLRVIGGAGTGTPFGTSCSMRLGRHRSKASAPSTARWMYRIRNEPAQQLQLELVDHQLEQCHLAIARLDDAQQFFAARL